MKKEFPYFLFTILIILSAVLFFMIKSPAELIRQNAKNVNPVLNNSPITISKEKKYTYQYTERDLADEAELNKLPVTPTPPGSVRIPILLYHHISDEKQDSYYVSPEMFRQQMAWLYDNSYKVISLSDAIDYIQFGNFCHKCVVITFDDGATDQYDNAVPILQEYNYPATFFVVPTWSEKKGYMNERQVQTLDKAGFTIGSHAWTHRDMQAASPEERDFELAKSKEYFENLLGKKMNVFAYPGGMLNSEAIAAVQKAGYRYALSVNKTIDHKPTDFYTLGRMHIDNDIPYFIARIEGRYKK